MCDGNLLETSLDELSVPVVMSFTFSQLLRQFLDRDMKIMPFFLIFYAPIPSLIILHRNAYYTHNKVE